MEPNRCCNRERTEPEPGIEKRKRQALVALKREIVEPLNPC
jgi:hypothetical protein